MVVICNVAGFPLDFERVDDGERTKKQSESGGERDGGEEANVDGNGLVVETLVQDWSSLDREVQHERSDCHQRMNSQLGRSCCQIGQL